MSFSDQSCQPIPYLGIASIMVRVRPLLWLIALFAIVVPTLGMTLVRHASLAVGQASADCPEHAPPPAPCPANGTAKHAAGDCWPLMSSTLALPPPTADCDATMPIQAPVTKPVRSLAGHVLARDPPPPRVRAEASVHISARGEA